MPILSQLRSDHRAGRSPVFQRRTSDIFKKAYLSSGRCLYHRGEPTLSPDLEALVSDIKKLGFLVKLDTNGYRPSVIRNLCQKNLLDYIAMDIKSSPENYGTVTGIPGIRLSPIMEVWNL